eukprot:5530974-Pleurochrysis_carterae.AAC.1
MLLPTTAATAVAATATAAALLLWQRKAAAALIPPPEPAQPALTTDEAGLRKLLSVIEDEILPKTLLYPTDLAALQAHRSPNLNLIPDRRAAVSLVADTMQAHDSYISCYPGCFGAPLRAPALQRALCNHVRCSRARPRLIHSRTASHPCID